MIRKTLLLSATLGLVLPLACDPDDDDTGGGDTEGTDGVPAEYAGKTNPVDGDSAAIASGMTQYDALCASCHGATGAGDGASGMGSMPPPTDFTATTGQADDYMLWTISDGIMGTTMGAYKGSKTEAEILEIVAYVRTLQ
ncbi:MAG: cytochrome c [Myxococcota bacterium]